MPTVLMPWSVQIRDRRVLVPVVAHVRLPLDRVRACIVVARAGVGQRAIGRARVESVESVESVSVSRRGILRLCRRRVVVVRLRASIDLECSRRCVRSSFGGGKGEWVL
jgi:hypothetical protein